MDIEKDASDYVKRFINKSKVNQAINDMISAACIGFYLLKKEQEKRVEAK